jgi:hypothetical protein
MGGGPALKRRPLSPSAVENLDAEIGVVPRNVEKGGAALLALSL